jgi:hypothetical protein
MKWLLGLILFFSTFGLCYFLYPPLACAQAQDNYRFDDLTTNIRDNRNSIEKYHDSQVDENNKLWEAIRLIQLQEANENGAWTMVKIFFGATSVLSGIGVSVVWKGSNKNVASLRS